VVEVDEEIVDRGRHVMYLVADVVLPLLSAMHEVGIVHPGRQAVGEFWKSFVRVFMCACLTADKEARHALESILEIMEDNTSSTLSFLSSVFVWPMKRRTCS
jgi:hypothetical protein